MTANLPGRYDPQDSEEVELPEVSERSRSVALVLGLLGGVFGFHRFYVGRAQSGVAMVLTFGGLGLWWLYDMVTIVAGEFRDADDLPLRNWQVAETVAGVSAGSTRQVQQLTQQMEQVQRQLGELAERVDFAERLLTQQRERDRLPKGS
ncbi:MAG TPA: TM2 domain-containing protein [Gemmatimonadales bacterium]|jgi:TM2 domain-containing membrane protein YozV